MVIIIILDKKHPSFMQEYAPDPTDSQQEDCHYIMEILIKI